MRTFFKKRNCVVFHSTERERGVKRPCRKVLWRQELGVLLMLVSPQKTPPAPQKSIAVCTIYVPQFFPTFFPIFNLGWRRLADHVDPRYSDAVCRDAEASSGASRPVMLDVPLPKLQGVERPATGLRGRLRGTPSWRPGECCGEGRVGISTSLVRFRIDAVFYKTSDKSGGHEIGNGRVTFRAFHPAGGFWDAGDSFA